MRTTFVCAAWLMLAAVGQCADNELSAKEKAEGWILLSLALLPDLRLDKLGRRSECDEERR